MAALKVVLYFLSGFCVIGGAICIGLFFHNDSIQALGSGALLLCIGVAGLLVSIFLEPLVRALKSENARG
jgi:hypothetical protein